MYSLSPLVHSSVVLQRQSFFRIDSLHCSEATDSTFICWSCSISCSPPSSTNRLGICGWFLRDSIIDWRSEWIYFKFRWFMFSETYTFDSGNCSEKTESLETCKSFIHILFQALDVHLAALEGPNRHQHNMRASKHIRARMLTSCESMLSVEKRDFEQSLLDLHRKTNHLGSDHCCSATCRSVPNKERCLDQ